MMALRSIAILLAMEKQENYASSVILLVGFANHWIIFKNDHACTTV